MLKQIFISSALLSRSILRTRYLNPNLFRNVARYQHSTSELNSGENKLDAVEEDEDMSNQLDALYSVIPSNSWLDSNKPISITSQHHSHTKSCDLESVKLRTMYDSYLQVNFDFTADSDMIKSYENSVNEIDMGKLFEDMDRLAAGVAYKYCNEVVATSSMTVVTASVDTIKLRGKIVPGRKYRLSGHVSYVGYSSMEVFLRMDQVIENLTEPLYQFDGNNFSYNQPKYKALLDAKFTMVARNKFTKKAIQIPPLWVQNESEKVLFNQGLAAKASKMNSSKYGLDRQPPNSDERLIIHDLYLESKNYLNSSAQLPKDVKWTEDTEIRSVTLCQPQDRNVHNFIFGGYLMRLAYQLAWICGYTFLPSLPQLLQSDEILFRKSVPVGSILHLVAKVPYCHGSCYQVSVEAYVNSVEEKNWTNTFHFKFQADTQMRSLPKSYDEMIKYLQARRRDSDLE